MSDQLKDEAFAPELQAGQGSACGRRWLHEVKWDGYRIVATVVAGNVRLWSRNAIEWTKKVPELAEAIASLKLKSAQLDGEMIVLRGGVSNFNALQARSPRTSRNLRSTSYSTCRISMAKTCATRH